MLDRLLEDLIVMLALRTMPTWMIVCGIVVAGLILVAASADSDGGDW